MLKVSDGIEFLLVLESLVPQLKHTLKEIDNEKERNRFLVFVVLVSTMREAQYMKPDELKQFILLFIQTVRSGRRDKEEMLGLNHYAPTIMRALGFVLQFLDKLESADA